MTDILTIVCPGCGTRLRTASTAAGRRAKCPRCGGAIVVEPPGTSTTDSARPNDAKIPAGAAGSAAQPPGAESPHPTIAERPRLELASNVAEARGMRRSANPSSREAGRRRGWILIGGAFVILAVIGAAFWTGWPGPETGPTTEEPRVGDRAPAANLSPHSRSAESVEVIPESASANSSVDSAPATSDAAAQPVDPTRLWDSPTAGTPIEWRFVPTEARLLIAIRPRALVEHPEGPRLVEALGALFGDWVAQAEAALARPFAAWDRIEAGAWIDHQGQVAWCFSGESSDELTADGMSGLGQAWNPQGDTAQAWLEGDLLRWLAADASPVTLVAGPREAVAELVAAAGAAPDRLPSLSALARTSDRERLVSLVAVPEFLADEGQQLWRVQAPRLGRWWPWLWGDDATAVALDLHLDQDLFTELRLAVPGNAEREVAAARLRISEFPGHVAALPAPAGSPGGRFAERWSAMLQSWQQFTTVAALDRQVVVRSYLPAAAAHNLAWGARLSWLEGDTLPAASTPVATTQRPLSERLRDKMSLALPRNPLERALTLFGEELGVGVTIDGAALEREGITRNQSLAFEARDLPAAEVLEQLLLRANPDGKLTFVIEPDPAGGERLRITTREASSAGAAKDVPPRPDAPDPGSSPDEPAGES